GGWVWCAPRRNIRSIWAGVAAASGCARGPYVRPFLSEGGDVLMCVETARIWQYPELDFLRPARHGFSRLPTECAPGCVERRAKRRDAADRDRHWPQHSDPGDELTPAGPALRRGEVIGARR